MFRLITRGKKGRGERYSFQILRGKKCITEKRKAARGQRQHTHGAEDGYLQVLVTDTLVAVSIHVVFILKFFVWILKKQQIFVPKKHNKMTQESHHQ